MVPLRKVDSKDNEKVEYIKTNQNITTNALGSLKEMHFTTEEFATAATISFQSIEVAQGEKLNVSIKKIGQTSSNLTERDHILTKNDSFEASNQTFSELYLPLKEHAAGVSEGIDNGMDDGYKKLIDRIDQDVRDHKQETRDRDARLQSEMQEREKRYHEEAKEREERILSAIKESNKNIESQINDMKDSLKRSEDRLDETAKHVHSMVTQNFWGRIATLVAIIAICATIAGTVWAAFKTATPQPTPTTTQNQTK